MVLDELEERYGLYLAEMVRQNVTLEEFRRLEIEELVPFFALRAGRAYQEYLTHKDKDLPAGSPAQSQDTYFTVLRRRWQQSEELAQMLLEAQRNYEERIGTAIVA